MSRPAPTVILEKVDTLSRKNIQVILSNGIWAVYYKELPFNIKTQSTQAFMPPRYKPTSFPNKGHAVNLAKKLNNQFQTNEFTAVLLTHAIAHSV